MPADFSLPVGGVDLAVYGDRARAKAHGGSVLCLHETGATAASWAGLAATLDGRAQVLRYDRRGWGESSAPEPYLRTTVGEQAQDALGLLDELDLAQATLAGAGLGAVAAIDLALREPDRVTAVVAIEPPLLSLADGATEGLSEDVQTLRDAAEEAGHGFGSRAAADLFMAGELHFLAPGAARLGQREAQGGGDGGEPRRRPVSLIAELGAVAAWSLPFEGLTISEIPLAIVIGAETPQPLRQAAATFVNHAPSAELVDLDQPDPLTAPEMLSRLIA